MTRDIYIRRKGGIRRYVLGKEIRPLTIVNRRLYRTDDGLLIADRYSDHQLVMYDVESTQPYFTGPVSPDETMAYIEIIKRADPKGVSKISALSGVNPDIILYAIVGVVILGSVIFGGIA